MTQSPPTDASTLPPEHQIEGVGRVTMDPTGLYFQATPAEAMAAPVTATEKHFVIAHHGIARCSAEAWTLSLIDSVGNETKLALQQIKDLPAREVSTVLACAGDPEDPDKPWPVVSNAIWRGPSLRSLLTLMGACEARYVWSRGVDWGAYAGEVTNDYVKDMPIAKAMDDDVILAYEMNGAALTPEHGFPLRVIVPGYYGTNSVKWLATVSLHDERPSSLFTTRLYNDWRSGAAVPVWEVDVNSLLLTPAAGARLPLAALDIVGRAWGHEAVQMVELSVDGGANWFAAELEPRTGSYAWQTFRARSTPKATGCYEIAVRARDVQGHVQPEDLHINQVQRVPIVVE